MFLYNLKLNKKFLIRVLFIIIFIIIIFIFSISIYKIFFEFKSSTEKNDNIVISDSIKTDEIFELTPQNYATVLQTVTDNLDSYIGTKIHFIGYVYRLIDFKENEFVLARNMKINENTNQTLIIGFFCEFDNAKSFKDGTWVEVTGKIVKGDYYGDIAKIQISDMFETHEPSDKLADPPDKTYIPTSNMF